MERAPEYLPPLSLRHAIEYRDVHLSYVDFAPAAAGRLPLLVALHGHFGCARNFALLAAALAGRWRVVALDQRGHGHSDHPPSVARADYVADAAAFLRHLGEPAVLLGHSLGGVNAYQLAARHPALVRALIIEDVGARHEVVRPLGEDWPRRYDSLSSALAQLDRAGIGPDRHFLDSLAEFPDGWGFRFDPIWVNRSQHALVGDWSDDWAPPGQVALCPTLLIRGTRSSVLNAAEAGRMVARRAGSRLCELEGGHTLHDDVPATFAAVLRDFLDSVSSEH